MTKEIKLDYKILYVEDELEIRANYISYLKKHFKEVYEAGDGEEALSIYTNHKPEILIIDIHIPKMNGLELLTKIRKLDHSTKAIMLTAHSDVEYLLKASELKLTKYLIKPITRSELKEALDLVLTELSSFTTLSNKLQTLNEDFLWNKETKELFKNNSLVNLTLKESKLLTLFLNNLNRTISYEEVIIYVWDNLKEVTTESVKTIVKNLRKKLPKGSIQNIYGIGYKFIN